MPQSVSWANEFIAVVPGVIPALGRSGGRESTPIDLIGAAAVPLVVAAAVWIGYIGRRRDADHFGPIRYERGGSERATGDLTLTFGPVGVAGPWRMEWVVWDEKCRVTADEIEPAPGSRPLDIRHDTVAGGRRNRPPYTWQFSCDDPRPARVAFRLRFAYVAPLEFRSFRLPRKLHGTAMDVGWSAVLRSRQPPAELPTGPVLTDVTYGFPVRTEP